MQTSIRMIGVPTADSGLDWYFKKTWPQSYWSVRSDLPNCAELLVEKIMSG